MISKAQIKHILSLHNKKNRLEEKLFIVEGTKIVTELIASNTYKIHSIYHTNSFDITQKDLKKIAFEINEKELEQISTLSNPNQVLALVHLNEKEIYTIDANQCYIALDEIKDPGNMGTIIRTAEWFGINTIFCSSCRLIQSASCLAISNICISKLLVSSIVVSFFSLIINLSPKK